MIGKSVAHYRITEKIGSGGMGDVYRAHDSKLGRDVALKVLPDVFVQDAGRMARFEREAQLLASLNHPNIAAIYGIEEAEGTRCLVLELVDGETLAERIKRGPISIEEALPIALQIARALESAHEKGIIHRDLKPANIIITPEGTVKVLDFGLAKALAEEFGDSVDLSQSPTLSPTATRAGVILGTAAYMSPEQAKDKKVDRRADIWSFGIVLLEMLTGKPAYQGETLSETLAAVMMTEPDWDGLPSTTPASMSVRRLLERCLRKDPMSRLRDIGEARIQIEEMPEEAAPVEPGRYRDARAGKACLGACRGDGARRRRGDLVAVAPGAAGATRVDTRREARDDGGTGARAIARWKPSRLRCGLDSPALMSAPSPISSRACSPAPRGRGSLSFHPTASGWRFSPAVS